MFINLTRGILRPTQISKQSSCHEKDFHMENITTFSLLLSAKYGTINRDFYNNVKHVMFFK